MDSLHQKGGPHSTHPCHTSHTPLTPVIPHILHSPPYYHQTPHTTLGPVIPHMVHIHHSAMYSNTPNTYSTKRCHVLHTHILYSALLYPTYSTHSTQPCHMSQSLQALLSLVTPHILPSALSYLTYSTQLFSPTYYTPRTPYTPLSSVIPHRLNVQYTIYSHLFYSTQRCHTPHIPHAYIHSAHIVPNNSIHHLQFKKFSRFCLISSNFTSVKELHTLPNF